jgi:hypothetical protein
MSRPRREPPSPYPFRAAVTTSLVNDVLGEYERDADRRVSQVEKLTIYLDAYVAAGKSISESNVFGLVDRDIINMYFFQILQKVLKKKGLTLSRFVATWSPLIYYIVTLEQQAAADNAQIMAEVEYKEAEYLKTVATAKYKIIGAISLVLIIVTTLCFPAAIKPMQIIFVSFILFMVLLQILNQLVATLLVVTSILCQSPIYLPWLLLSILFVYICVMVDDWRRIKRDNKQKWFY